MTDRPGEHPEEASRLWAMIDAATFVHGELRLDALLERIVENACEIIGARYGALGVIDESGSGLAEFHFRGLTERDRERIGSLPVGRGLLGALITDPKPVRLENLTKDPRSVGFPKNHPAMTSFLGVPIRARGKVFGNLYLTEKIGAAEFTEEDERLTVLLAGQAGVAIENARFYEEARRNEETATQRLVELELVQDVGAALLEELDPDRVLRMIVLRARGIAAADTALLALREDDDVLRVRVAAGDRAGPLEGMRLPIHGSVGGSMMTTLGPRLVGDLTGDRETFVAMLEAAHARSAVFAPLVERGRSVGILAVFRHAADSLGENDLFLVKRFASLASLALQNARAVAGERERFAIEAELAETNLRNELQAHTLRAVIRAQEEERRRIARELHDTAGQSLAAILLGLKVARDEDTLDGARRRLEDLREMTSAATAEVRRISLELRPTALDDMGLEAALARYTQDVEHRTGIRFSTDIVLKERLASEVETVLYRVVQESVTNSLKYAHAEHIAISLDERDGTVKLVVADDGRGFDTKAAKGLGLGLLGMQERAQLIGGRVTVRSAPGKGTVVTLDVKREVTPR